MAQEVCSRPEDQGARPHIKGHITHCFSSSALATHFDAKCISHVTRLQASCKAKLAKLAGMQISELAQLTGVSTHALRHYEKLGMLEPARRASGYREYPESMRREVIFIAMSRKVGIPLKLIAEQLPAYRAGRLTVTQMAEALLARVLEIDQQTERLKTQRNEVLSHVEWLRQQERAYQAKKVRVLWPRVPAPSRPKSPPVPSEPKKVIK